MKKFYFMAFLALLLILPGAVRAWDGSFYLTPKLTTGFQNTDWELSAFGSKSSRDSSRGIAGFAIAGGYDFSCSQGLPFRAELEYGYNSSVDKSIGNGEGEARVQTLMVNGYWDITNIGAFTPYVGVGLGLAFVKLRGHADSGGWHYGSSENDVALAGQIGFGCSYMLAHNMSADLGYRYMFAGDSESGYGSYNLRADSLRLHQIMLGLRFNF